jgi:chromosome segregation ATPase
MFLTVERAAAEHIDNENSYWDSIYSGMQDMLDQFKTIETKQVVVENEIITNKKDVKEKVFYIETQGKKIDGEVNKLKDIISEQENTLNSLRKSLKDDSGADIAVDADVLSDLTNRLNDFERQLTDSKMCMEVLELENDRLQQEINDIEKRHADESAGKTNKDEAESTSMIDLDQMKEVLEKQEQQIQDLHSTIENLEIDAQQAEKLKSTINDFTRTSQEMMGCISILEEENELLKGQLSDNEPDTEETPSIAAAPANNEEAAQLKSKLKGLEQEIIKKDVAYAKLQDEYSSMEKEYLSMYEAIHGDNS